LVGADKAWPTDPFGDAAKPLPIHALIPARDGATVTVLVNSGVRRGVYRLNAAQIALAFD
jgi:hypothetical protein